VNHLTCATFGVRCVKLLLARGVVLVVVHQLTRSFARTSSRAPIRRPIGLRHILRWRPCVIPDRPSVGAGEVSELLVAFPRGGAALTLAITRPPRSSLLGMRTSVNG